MPFSRAFIVERIRAWPDRVRWKWNHRLGRLSDDAGPHLLERLAFLGVPVSDDQRDAILVIARLADSPESCAENALLILDLA